MSERPRTDGEWMSYALETLRLANENWSNLWPWRWFRWWRQDRLIARRLAEHDAALKRRGVSR